MQVRGRGVRPGHVNKPFSVLPGFPHFSNQEPREPGGTEGGFSASAHMCQKAAATTACALAELPALGTSAAAMTDTVTPSFFARIGLAFGMFFRVLFDAKLAGKARELSAGPGEEVAAPSASEPSNEPSNIAAVPTPSAVLREAPTESALQLLGLLQRKGRLVDFLMEDMSGYDDVDVGAAARAVHDGCHKVLSELLTVERIFSADEGATVTVEAGFDPSEVQLVGQVSGNAPFTGTLNHAGWRAKAITLPKLNDGHDANVLAPGEIEL